MKKCDATQMGSQKTYYNDHHENIEVVAYRGICIITIWNLQKRTRVWKIISEEEEDQYKTTRQWSNFESTMSLGEEVIIADMKKIHSPYG